MTQTSFHKRVAQIEAKHADPAPRRKRGLKFCVMLMWLSFFGLASGLWHTGAISSEKLATLVPTVKETVVDPIRSASASGGQSLADRKEGARWSSASDRLRSKGAFFTLSTKGSLTSPSSEAGFVDFIEMRVDREKKTKTDGRLGFEGQKALADKRRDKFWQRK